MLFYLKFKNYRNVTNIIYSLKKNYTEIYITFCEPVSEFVHPHHNVKKQKGNGKEGEVRELKPHSFVTDDSQSDPGVPGSSQLGCDKQTNDTSE